MKLWPVDFNSVKLVDFVKDFYVPTNSVERRSEEECEAIRSAHGIRILSGHDVPKVIVSFDESSFPEYLVRSLYRHFGPDASPTPIQMQGWPIAMSGRSVIGIAQTGSGKTLTYILPAIVHINAQPPAQPGEGPIALVLVPTRELCTQIAQEAEKFSQAVIEMGGVATKIACAFGGVKKSEQLWAIRDSLDILVAAPGRLIDFVSSNQLSLHRTTFVVMDEADEMLSMGFHDQLNEILSQIRPDRQCLFYSATWPTQVRSLARRVCTDNPVHIQVGSEELTANHQIEQIISFVSNDKEKMDKLFDEILPQLYMDEHGNRLKEDAKLLLFCNTKDGVDFLTKRMREQGVPAVAIHSGKEQAERLWVFEQFRNGDTKVLVSTNLMGRGVDVPAVNIVVNYDLPKNISEYIHRIGRTARARSLGRAISFFGYNDVPLVKDLVGVLNEANQIVPEWLAEFQVNPYYRKL
jgi:ATP-dependent RNA helicase DDX5/DBP2